MKTNQGSFGIPEELMKEVNKSKKKATGYMDSESIPEPEKKIEESKKKDEPESKYQNIKEIEVEVEKLIQIKMTED